MLLLFVAFHCSTTVSNNIQLFLLYMFVDAPHPVLRFFYIKSTSGLEPSSPLSLSASNQRPDWEHPLIVVSYFPLYWTVFCCCCCWFLLLLRACLKRLACIPYTSSKASIDCCQIIGCFIVVIVIIVDKSSLIPVGRKLNQIFHIGVYGYVL